MRLSIITINLNNLDGLKKTIDSIMTQTWRDFEWIIVDGGSTDGSKNLIEQTAANPDSNISWWCSEPDKGIYNAMNKGIRHAKGEYLSFMNSGDCFLDSNVLQLVSECHIDADVVYGDAEMVCADGTTYTKKMPDDLTIDFFFKDTIIHQATLIKRAIFQVFSYDETLKVASDRKIWFQCLLSEKSFVHLPFNICSFDMTGIGTIGKHKDECAIIINQLFPIAVQKSMQELAEYKSAFPQLPNLISHIKYRRLYKRIILFVLALFDWLKK